MFESSVISYGNQASASYSACVNVFESSVNPDDSKTISVYPFTKMLTKDIYNAKIRQNEINAYMNMMI